MSMAVAMRLIGARCGLERRFDFNGFHAKPPDHFGDHVVAPEPQPKTPDFHRQVPVAEVPRQCAKMLRAFASDFEQFFWRGDDFDQPIIFKRQSVTIAQDKRLREIKYKAQSMGRLQNNPAAVPAVIIEHNRVMGGTHPLAGMKGGKSTEHLELAFESLSLIQHGIK